MDVQIFFSSHGQVIWLDGNHGRMVGDYHRSSMPKYCFQQHICVIPIDLPWTDFECILKSHVQSVKSYLATVRYQ